MKRVAIVTSASGSGGTTVGREIARRLDVPFHDLDAVFWQPEWTEPDPDDFRERVAAIVATEHWVIDGSYQSWIGQLVLGNAEVVVWLDLPTRVWMPRLLRRTVARARSGEELWAGNRESLCTSFTSRDSLILHTSPLPRPSQPLPKRFASYDVIRLRTDAEVERLLSAIAGRATLAPRSTQPL